MEGEVQSGKVSQFLSFAVAQAAPVNGNKNERKNGFIRHTLGEDLNFSWEYIHILT